MVNLNLKIATKTAVNWSQQQQFTNCCCSIISRTDLQKPRLELLPSPAVSLGRDQLLPHGDCLFWHRTSCSVGYLLSGNRCNWTECSQTNSRSLSTCCAVRPSSVILVLNLTISPTFYLIASHPLTWHHSHRPPQYLFLSI